MGKRHSGAGKSAVATAEFKAGDVVWAPYRGAPEWPAVVRCVYPKKVTFTFLPIVEKFASNACVFSRPPNKLRKFLGTEKLPSNAKNDFKEAFRAALELTNNDSAANHFIDGHTPENLVSSDGGDSNNHQMLGDLDVKYSVKKEMDSVSNIDTASEASIPQWSVGDVAWLRTLDHTEWPVVIRELRKKFAMVDAFPLKTNGKCERYPLSACQKFDLTTKSLDAAIKKEHNYELRLALVGVQKYFNARRNEMGGIVGEISDTDEDDKIKICNAWKNFKMSAACVGLEEERESVGEAADNEAIKNECGSGSSSRGKRPIGSPHASSKRPKFSEAVKNLEAELVEKLEKLEKGDLVWINRARSGRIVKWPMLVLKVDIANKSCVCTELPLDDPDVSVEWCLNSEKTLVVQLKNIYLYDTVEVKIDEIEDEELKIAVSQAEDIADGQLRPFEKDMENEERASSNENGCKAEQNEVLAAKDIMRLSKSEMCSRHLMAIWNGQFSCSRHSNYDMPIIPSMHFEVSIGDLLSGADAIALVEHLDTIVAKFKDPIKSSLRRLDYITKVMLPEAIIFAITQIRYCSGREASEIFENAISHHSDKSPSESGNDVEAASGFEQLLKAASKVRCATLGVDQ